MTAFNPWTESHQKHKGESRVDLAAKKRTAKAENWRTVSKQVDKRDGWRCRACRTAVNPDGVDLLERGHRHHLTFRSKGGQDVASNLVTLCSRCHDAVHVKRTLRIEWGTYGADGVLEFWRQGPEGWYLSSRERAIGQAERD